MKRDLNFQHQIRPSRGPALEFEHLEDMAYKKKKPWRIDINVKELVIGIQEDPMLEMFTNHDEIVEILT